MLDLSLYLRAVQGRILGPFPGPDPWEAKSPSQRQNQGSCAGLGPYPRLEPGVDSGAQSRGGPVLSPIQGRICDGSGVLSTSGLRCCSRGGSVVDLELYPRAKPWVDIGTVPGAELCWTWGPINGRTQGPSRGKTKDRSRGGARAGYLVDLPWGRSRG